VSDMKNGKSRSRKSEAAPKKKDRPGKRTESTASEKKDRPGKRTESTASDAPKSKARPEPTAAKSDGADTKEGGRARRRATGEKRARLNENLILELRALRASLTQATEAFDLRVGGLIAEMLQSLEGDASLDQRPRTLTVAKAQAALETIAGAPDTGRPDRLRELRRIQRLTRRLRKQVASD